MMVRSLRQHLRPFWDPFPPFPHRFIFMHDSTPKTDSQVPGANRRDFLSRGTLAAAGTVAASTLSVAQAANAIGSDTIRVGVVGCGGRGTGAAIQALNTTGGGVELVAMADVFQDNLDTALNTITNQHQDKVKVNDNRFVGCDAYQQVLETDCDFVILATPPGFRPLHFEKAIEAGKHVFMEKPVASDVPGVKRVLKANEMAKEKGLGVQVGLQRRHEFRYNETIDKLKNGAIGDINFCRAYWNGSGVWIRPRKKEMTELEYQMRNWYYFNWLCGDHITEQHIHNLDVINWLADSHPVEAQGVGGRQVRTGPNTGQIYDHHMVEYTYPNGMKMLSECRHIRGCWNAVSEHAHGSKGTCDISKALIMDTQGNEVWQSDAEEANGKGWQQEHYDFFEALRKGERPNEVQYGAESTMTSILGRIATYTGDVVKWDDAMENGKSLADFDSLHSFDDEAPIQPDREGNYEVPMPGQYKWKA